jgi:hypothetical protein
MIVLSFLLACSHSHEEAGTADTDSGADSLDVANYTSSECTARLTTDTASGIPESIVATSDAAGTVHIAHTSLSANCCADITPNPRLSGTALALAYTESGEECDCMCTFDLTYDVTGVAAGTYAVTYADLSTTVTVP